MKNKKIIILALILASLAGVLGWMGISKTGRFGPPPKVLGVFPPNQATEVSLLPEITITFDKKVSPGEIVFSSNPPFSYQSPTTNSSIIVKYLPTQLLEKKTNYQITLKFKFGGEYAWSFTTGETEAGAVPGWAEGFQKAKKEYEAKYPPQEVDILNNIIQKVVNNETHSYWGDGFWIEYAERTQVFSVHLCQEPFEATRKKVEDWFNQQGLNKIVVMKKPEIDWLYGCEPPKIIPKVLPTP